jgi:predicted ABC-type ATPase
MLRENGAEYYNPDEAAAKLREQDPGVKDADSRAWGEGLALLERAIKEKLVFAFESTLGGNTIWRRLQEAAALGIEVKVWFVGLESPELNIARVKAREARGGQPVDDDTIRRRYDTCRNNLIMLVPFLAELRVYDNSKEGEAEGVPEPRLLLHMVRRKIVYVSDPDDTPDWVKPIIAAARNLAVA